MQNNIIRESSFQQQEEAKAEPKIVKFTNFSNEDFTWTWNKVPYTFPAREFRFMETNIANHFAKHLINRELLKKGRENDTSPKVQAENVYFMELYKKAIEGVDTAEGADDTALEQEVIDREMKAKLGLKQPTKPLNVPIKKVKTTTKAKIGNEVVEKTEDFEIIEGDDDDNE